MTTTEQTTIDTGLTCVHCHAPIVIDGKDWTHAYSDGGPGFRYCLPYSGERAALVAYRPVSLLGVTDIDDLDIADPTIITQDLEQVDIGGGGFMGSHHYARLSAPDLVVVMEALKRKADVVIEAVLDARQARAEAARVPCPGGCELLIEPDEPYCGYQSCRTRLEVEARDGAYL